MHQARGVVHQPHRLAFAETGPMTPRHKRYAQGMAGGPAGSLQHGIKDAILIAGEAATGAGAFLKNLTEVGGEALGERHGVAFAGVSIFAF